MLHHTVQRRTRDDVRLHVCHLCTKNSAPTVRDYSKALQVLRYVYSTPQIGRVFDSMDTDIYIYSDAAFMNQPDGRSTGAYFLSVGRDNAPFYSEVRAIRDVATCPMTAEYYAAGGSSKTLVHFRQLWEDLGWPLMNPTTHILDATTAINLIKAPEVTKNARHIHVMHHYIRDLFAQNILTPVHVVAADMRADVMTKYTPPKPYKEGVTRLLNLAAIS